MKAEEKSSWAREIVRRLRKEYPDSKVALHYSNPLELLVATILSAQATDAVINTITPALFQKYRSAADYARAVPAVFEREIRSSGFFRNKAKNIIAAARRIEEAYGGKVPRTMEELLTLPGVARKTANIVLYNAFNVTAGIAVDTHVRRLSQRLSLSSETDPEKIERDLMGLLPREEWGPLNALLIDHGRKVCQAKKPACAACVLNDRCPSAVMKE
jgi:endonuclease-3